MAGKTVTFHVNDVNVHVKGVTGAITSVTGAVKGVTGTGTAVTGAVKGVTGVGTAVTGVESRASPGPAQPSRVLSRASPGLAQLPQSQSSPLSHQKQHQHPTLSHLLRRGLMDYFSGAGDGGKPQTPGAHAGADCSRPGRN